MAQFLPVDRSDFNHEEFADESANIMPPGTWNVQFFKKKGDLRGGPGPGDLTSIDPGIRKNASTTNVNVPLEDDQSSLFAYVVWIFLAFLTGTFMKFNVYPKQLEERPMMILSSLLPHGTNGIRGRVKACELVNVKQGASWVATHAYPDFPDCEDSRARSIHKSFTSSASFWESSIQI
ncbi:hypothetical protein Tco_0149590 [Tanacetum coccineum]